MSRVINGDVILDSAPEQAEKFRLDHLLVEKYQSYNRSSLQTFIKSGFVKVDGVVVTKANAKFEKSAKLELNVPAIDKKSDLVPTVIYEDQFVLVLNKPAGLLSMAKGEYCPEKTLEDYGLLVHRLDRDTSGVVILAKDPETQAFLRKQFQDRKTHKTYYAITEGIPKKDEALIDLPIERNFKRPNTFLVTPNGKPSETYYKVLEKSAAGRALVELKPKTGRTHQLRVHLNYLGTPILGDPVYGAGYSTDLTRPNKSKVANKSAHKSSAPSADRLYLHAYSLEITIKNPANPAEKLRKTFVADLPENFRAMLNAPAK